MSDRYPLTEREGGPWATLAASWDLGRLVVRAPGRPLVTWGLIAVNVVVYVLFNLPMESKGADLRDPATLEYLRVLSQLTGVSASSLARSISAYDVFVFNYGFRPRQWHHS